VTVTLDLPEDLSSFRFPRSLDRRLQALLDKQDREGSLAPEERDEAEGLVDLAEMLSLLRARVQCL